MPWDRPSASTGSAAWYDRRAGLAPLYRLYDRRRGDHLYTASAAERGAMLAAGWHDEGVACRVVDRPEPGLAPLLRLFHPSAHDHAYEELPLVALYAGVVPLFALFRRATVDHFYTTSREERAAALAAGWDDEGVACFVAPP